MGFVDTVMTGVGSTIICSDNLKLRWLKSSDILVHKALILVNTGKSFPIAGQVANIWFPNVMPIWNPLFVLFSSLLSFLLMALFYFSIVVKGYQRWAFWLKVIGMNSIAVNVAVHLIHFDGIAQNLVFGLVQYRGEYYFVLLSTVALAIICDILYYISEKGTFAKVWF